MTENESTTECNRVDYGNIEQVISKHIGERTGVTLPPWPTKDAP